MFRRILGPPPNAACNRPMSHLRHRGNRNRNKIETAWGTASRPLLLKGRIMKSILAMMAVLLAASMAMAQADAGKPSAPAQGAQAGAAAPAPTGQHQPQAKSKEEFDAYNLAASKTDPAQAEAAADEFA